MSITYFVCAEDTSSLLAFTAIMCYLFYIDYKMDEKDN